LLSDATPIVLTAGRLDPTGETGLGLDGAFLSRLGVRMAPVAAVIAVDRALGARPGRAVDAGTFADQLAAAVALLRGAVRVVHAGILAGEAQAEALAAAARELGMPLVADLAWRGPGGLGALDAAALVVAGASDAARVTGRPFDGSRAALRDLARALAGPARVAVVGGGPTGPGGEEPETADPAGTPAALAGPAGESIVEAVAITHAQSRGASGARSIAAAGYLALGLPAADAAAAAHRFVASSLAAAAALPGRAAAPEPWRV
jgi:hydroxymethylpyrimidine/phosphomethylpyrimidine kinase